MSESLITGPFVPFGPRKKDRSHLYVGAAVILLSMPHAQGLTVNGLVAKIHADDTATSSGIPSDAVLQTGPGNDRGTRQEIKRLWTGKRPLIDAMAIMIGPDIDAVPFHITMIPHHLDVETELIVSDDVRTVEWFPRYLVIPDMQGA